MTREKKEKVLTARQAARMGRILTSARDLLGEIGMERMTMRDLAAVSGVSAATLYNRFGTKDSLVAHAVVDHYEQAIRKVVERGAKIDRPIDQIIYVIRVIIRDCLRRPGFANALMSAYFKIGNEQREMPDRLYAALMQSWLSPLQVLADDRALQEWISLQVLAEELSDRMFGIVMKWSQGMVSDAALTDRALVTILLPLVASAKGAAAKRLNAELVAAAERLRDPAPVNPRAVKRRSKP